MVLGSFTAMSFRPFQMIGYPDEFFAQIGECFRSIFTNLPSDDADSDIEIDEAVVSINEKKSFGIFCSECKLWMSGPKEYKIHKLDDNHRLKSGLLFGGLNIN